MVNVFVEEDCLVKALFFLNSFAGGGAERVCLNLAEQLYKQGIESEFITIFNKKPDYDIPDYIQIFCLKIEDKALECFEIIKKIPKVNAYISGKKYVLITAHVQPSQFLASLTTVGRKCLYVMHGSQHMTEKKSSWLYKTGLKLFLRKKKVVTVSEGLKSELTNEYGIPSESIITIYNPCPLSGTNNMPKSASPYGRKYILVMGRLEKEKNPMGALDLYNKGKIYEKYDLIYLGQGSLEDELKRRIGEYKLNNHVYLAGFKKKSAQWIMNASLLLSCSKYEGLPMNIVEALVYKVPVVAVDCRYGPREILTGDLAQYLINPEERPTESIKIIWSALEHYPKITAEYYEKFNVELIVQIYMSVWNNFFE